MATSLEDLNRAELRAYVRQLRAAVIEAHARIMNLESGGLGVELVCRCELCRAAAAVGRHKGDTNDG